ncbi:hypothetical protein ACVWZ8_001229 [Arthrobacter sp. UYCu723]
MLPNWQDDTSVRRTLAATADLAEGGAYGTIFAYGLVLSPDHVGRQRSISRDSSWFHGSGPGSGTDDRLAALSPISTWTGSTVRVRLASLRIR